VGIEPAVAAKRRSLPFMLGDVMDGIEGGG
jgi:hypothetical protein